MAEVSAREAGVVITMDAWTVLAAELAPVAALAIGGAMVWLVWALTRPRSKVGAGGLVVITGCDSGIGRALALRVRSISLMPIALCLTQREADALTEDSDFSGEAFRCDITSVDDVARVTRRVRELVDAGQPLHAVVNNAGARRAAPPRLPQSPPSAPSTATTPPQVSFTPATSSGSTSWSASDA